MGNNPKIADNSNWHQFIPAPYESVVLIPIHNKGITIGLIQLNDHRIGKFDSDRIEFLEMFGDIIGSKILDNDEILPPDYQDFNHLLITICSFCRRAKLESMKWVSLEEYFSKVENIEKISFKTINHYHHP